MGTRACSFGYDFRFSHGILLIKLLPQFLAKMWVVDSNLEVDETLKLQNILLEACGGLLVCLIMAFACM